jgi:hydroxymethylpyrimidine kinase/phosphomethylpyrimidine kinase
VADSVPRVLSIAGTDPTGGAGIQADLKAIAAHRGHGMAVVTCLVAQNTQGVRAVHTPSPTFLREQLLAVSDDVTLDAVKIGMLGDREVVAVVSDWLGVVRPPLVVLDPVMVATSGDRLLDAGAEGGVRALCSSADLVTPNLPELGVLVDEPTAADWSTALRQAMDLSQACGAVVLAKGGHLSGAPCPDALVDAHGRVPGGTYEIAASRVHTRNTHGTGCSLSSAMATLLARTGDWVVSLQLAKAWLLDSLRHADELDVGRGSGPIHHFHQLWSAATPATPSEGQLR